MTMYSLLCWFCNIGHSLFLMGDCYIMNLQDALLKSNEVFETFKQEIEKVHTSIETTFHKSTDFDLLSPRDSRCNLPDMLSYLSVFNIPDGQVYQGPQEGKHIPEEQM